MKRISMMAVVFAAISCLEGGQALAGISEISLLAGEQRNSADSAPIGQLEYRWSQNDQEWLGLSLCYIKEAALAKPAKPWTTAPREEVDRNGLAGQIWLGLSPLSDWRVSIGAGPYFYQGEPESGVAVIGSLDLSFSLAPVVFRLRLNTINNSDNNAQSLLFGLGYEFGR